MIDRKDYFNVVALMLKENPDYRLGQAMFNALELLSPSSAHYMRGTPSDPFHRDELIPDFLKVVFMLD